MRKIKHLVVTNNIVRPYRTFPGRKASLSIHRPPRTKIRMQKCFLWGAEHP